MKTRRRTKQAQRKPKYRFTREDCQRGYRAALEKCNEDWDLAAWLFRRVRSHYRRKAGIHDA